jgi:diacylglycerol O-acyltransferase
MPQHISMLCSNYKKAGKENATDMKFLSGLDASFLHLETADMPMHIGGLMLLDLPYSDDGDFYEKVKLQLISRLHLLTAFTRKLVLMPLEFSNPMWIENADIDIDYHVRKMSLPKSGTMSQLESTVAHLHSSLLDRSRPLWEFTVLEGLKSGQVAIYFKVHHAVLDGQGAEALAQTLLDVTPVPRKIKGVYSEKKTSKVEFRPELTELIGAGLRNNAGQYWNAIKALPAAVAAIGHAVGVAKEHAHDEDKNGRTGLSKSLKFAPKTPLNVSISKERALATVSLSISEAKEVARAFGGSLNDVVLAICSGTLRAYLQDKNALPEETLVAAIPVSLREPGNSESNNQVSMMLIDLATHLADPKKRMRAIVKSSTSLKSTLKGVKSALPTNFPSIGVPWLMTRLTALYERGKLADRIPPVANVIISNVSGPRVPLYLAGAKISADFPVSAVIHGIALNITMMSYVDSLDIGLLACRDVVPDIKSLAKMLVATHRELLKAARDLDAASASRSKTSVKRVKSRINVKEA